VSDEPRLNSEPTARSLLELVQVREGHFLLESGHHGELWLDLDSLLLHPAVLAPFATELGQRLLVAAPGLEAICGPLIGGALIAQMIAERVSLDLYYSVPHLDPRTTGLFPVGYQVPDAVRATLEGKKLAVVDDAFNAGSATRATIADLRAAGAEVKAIGALFVSGAKAAEYAREERLALVHVAQVSNRIWPPDNCPHCRAGEPLEHVRANRGARM
jgi:orotate phosphoribosyltransferase